MLEIWVVCLLVRLELAMLVVVVKMVGIQSGLCLGSIGVGPVALCRGLQHIRGCVPRLCAMTGKVLYAVSSMHSVVDDVDLFIKDDGLVSRDLCGLIAAPVCHAVLFVDGENLSARVRFFAHDLENFENK
eukprot:scaffold33806_cov45-Attheya_sp.AAC.2